MTSMLSWQNCQPFPCFILYSKAKFACYSRYLLTSYFTFQNDIFFGVSFLKVLQVFIELFNFSFFSVTDWGIDLDYCDFEQFALETNRDHSVVFEISGSPHGISHPRQRSRGRDLVGKGKSRLKGPPGPARPCTPKPESVCLTISCLSPPPPTLTGGGCLSLTTFL